VELLLNLEESVLKSCDQIKKIEIKSF